MEDTEITPMNVDGASDPQGDGGLNSTTDNHPKSQDSSAKKESSVSQNTTRTPIWQVICIISDQMNEFMLSHSGSDFSLISYLG